MISAKSILEKLSAKDRKAFDAMLSEYHRQVGFARDAAREKGLHIPANLRQRHKQESAALRSEFNKSPSPELRERMEQLAKRQAMEVSESDKLKRQAVEAGRVYQRAAATAIKGVWPLLVPPAEALRDEYTKRHAQDRERLGAIPDSLIVKEIEAVIRALKIQTGEIVAREFGEVFQVSDSWLAGKTVTRPDGSNKPEPEPVEVTPEPSPEDRGVSPPNRQFNSARKNEREELPDFT